MADKSVKQALQDANGDAASTTRTGAGAGRMGISNLSSRQEDIKVCVELALGTIEAYRAVGSPYGDGIDGLEQWLKQTIAEATQDKDEAVEKQERGGEYEGIVVIE